MAKYALISGASGAALLMRMRALPNPRAWAALENTSRSASLYWRPSRPPGSSPRLRRSVTLVPMPRAQASTLAFAPVVLDSSLSTPAWNRSQTRGTAKNTVGSTSLRLSASFSSDSA